MNNLAVAEKAERDGTWEATLELQLERSVNSAEKTRLSRCRHNGPLYVQKPFYPEGPSHPHLYILHPPGGIVSGDCLNIHIDIGPEAAALVTTPGAARIYRAREQQSLQQQHVTLNVSENGIAEWFPLETIVFNGARVEVNTTINIADDSHVFAWEVTCFGLPASDEPFEAGSFKQHYQLNKNGLPLFVDRMTIAGGDRVLGGKAGMQNQPVTGFFLAGPISDDSESLMETLRDVLAKAGVSDVAAMSKVGDLYIGRYLGGSAEQAREIFTQWWQLLRPLIIKKEACPPRIWAT